MMKIVCVLCTLLASASAFGVSSNVHNPARPSSTALAVNLAPEDMTAAQREIVQLQTRWNSVRLLSAEEAAALEDEELKAAHTRYFERYHQDMTKMEEIAAKLVVMLEPPKIARKSNSQRKRDKWALVQARTAARAAAK